MTIDQAVGSTFKRLAAAHFLTKPPFISGFFHSEVFTPFRFMASGLTQLGPNISSELLFDPKQIFQTLQTKWNLEVGEIRGKKNPAEAGFFDY